MSEPAESSEAKELSLVERLELRLALADSEAKLQSLLNTFLCPLLLKLLSPHKRVRDKVITVCHHVNTRIKVPSIRLPAMPLLKQFKENNSSLLRHFDLLYISQGLPRLTERELTQLLPTLVGGIAKNFSESATNTAVLFSLFLRILHRLNLPPRESQNDMNLKEELGLTRADDTQFIAMWIGKLLLFQPSAQQKSIPGLTAKDREFLQPNGNASTWDLTAGGLPFVETKVICFKLLASSVFTETEKLVPALFASADLNLRLSELGDDVVKRILPSVSLEDNKLVSDIFSLYLGRTDQDVRLPVKVALQVRLLGILSRSQEAANHQQEILKVIEAGLITPDSATDEVGPQKRGLELAKLRVQLFNFVRWVSQNANQETLEHISSELIDKLRRFVEYQGWPSPPVDISTKDVSERSSRNYCYESIGLITKSHPNLLLQNPGLRLLRWLFQSLACDTWGSETVISIEGALASVMGIFANDLETSIENVLADLLLEYTMQRPDDLDSSGNKVIRSTRYAAVRFANRCLPFENSSARLIDLLALSEGEDARKEIMEESKRGLDPFWHRNLNSQRRFIQSQAESSVEEYHIPNSDELIRKIFMNDTQVNSAEKALTQAVIFCRNVLFHNALAAFNRAPVIDHNWQKNLDALIENDEKARLSIRKCLEEYKEAGSSPIELLMDRMFLAMTRSMASEAVTAGQLLCELCSLGPRWLTERGASRVSEFKALIHSNNHSLRVVASRLFGLLCSGNTSLSNDIIYTVNDYLRHTQDWSSAIGQTVNEVHGSMLAIAFFLSRSFTPNRVPLRLEEPLKNLLTIISEILVSGNDRDLIGAAMMSLDQLLLFGMVLESDLPKDDALIERLNTLSKENNELAVVVLGRLAMQSPEDFNSDSKINKILKILYELHEQRRPELHFVVGSSLSCAAIGWSSKSLIGVCDQYDEKPPTQHREQLFTKILNTVLGFCNSTKPSLRQASVIWLLCLVQYCGHLTEILSRLRVLQKAFMGFLADREPLNQETASRGLTIVYENGDRSIKDELIRDLVGSFTSTNSSFPGNVTADTELFEPGALPTGANSSITTYKDIIHLANEAGDPSLVYRLMSLASSSSIWSSRAAFGRFGLSKILSDSSVNGYLARNSKIYPTLYRYRFDPNTNVKRAMNEIWSTIVTDTKETIDMYFSEIVEDLLKSITGKEWRTREASCAALGDLLQGRAFKDYEQYLTRIWTATFKVCDDIKETVRRAAMALAKVLTGNLVRSFEAAGSSAGATDKMLQGVLPFLLSPSGIESSAPEVQSFALGTLLDIIKKGASRNLGPYLGELIGDRLLPLLSSLEPGEINYIHLNAEKYGMTEQQIDDARLSNVKTSPMMEAIEQCLDMLDEKSMQELVPRLSNAIRSVVGLPSRVGVSRVLVSLSTKHNRVFKPYADQFLRQLRKHVLDRNETISASVATACGYISRIASNSEVIKHTAYAKQLYFDSEDERSRSLSGELMLSLAKYATDKFQSISSSLLPFIFIAMQDTNEIANEVFKKAWDEGMGGTRAIKLYFLEISEIVSEHLSSHKWPIKHASSLSVAKIIKYLGKDITQEEARAIWPLMEGALSGKTWDGKERVLDAFVTFVQNARYLREDSDIASKMQRIMLRESKRNNRGIYRRQSMQSLGDFIGHFPSQYWFEEVHHAISPILESLLGDDDEMDIDLSETPGLSPKLMKVDTISNAIKTLIMSVNTTSSQASHLNKDLTTCLKWIPRVANLGDAQIHNAIFDSEKVIFQKISAIEGTYIDSDVFCQYLETTATHESAPELTRIKSLEALGSMVPVIRRNYGVAEKLREVVNKKMGDRSTSVQASLMKVQELLNGLNNNSRPL